MENNPQSKELDQIAKRSTVEAWAAITIKEFQKALEKKKIIDTRHLFNSFIKELRANGGDVQAVLLKLAMYGRYQDMGVGRGMKAYERKTNKANLIAAKRYGANVSYVSRQPRKWYNKVRFSQTLRLQEILIRDLGDDINKWVLASFEGEVKTGL